MGTVSNALTILDCFPLGEAGIGLAELARATRKNKATVYRYLCALESKSFVEQDHDTRRYRVGPALTRLAQGRRRRAGARELISPIVESLSAVMSSWVVLYEVTNDAFTPSVLFHDGTGRIPDQTPGFSCPNKHSSTGVIFATFGQDEARSGDLAHFIQPCRTAGFARTPDAKSDGLQSVSAPIFGSAGTLAFIVTLVMPAMADRYLSAFGYETILILAATAATSAIGGRPKQIHPRRRAQ